MGRLIDADDLINWINEQRDEVTKEQVAGTRESIFTKEVLITMQRCISTFENKIKTQPTAYDPNKVVQQLEDEKEFAYADFDEYVNEVCPHLDAEYDDLFKARLERAIEIVKGGGVDA